MTAARLFLATLCFLQITICSSPLMAEHGRYLYIQSNDIREG